MYSFIALHVLNLGQWNKKKWLVKLKKKAGLEPNSFQCFSDHVYYGYNSLYSLEYNALCCMDILGISTSKYKYIYQINAEIKTDMNRRWTISFT